MITMTVLGVLALGPTVTMFATRNMLLGFPSAIFWGILGGYSYQQSSETWDWQYILFFSAMGMVIFSVLAMYALRKKDLAEPDTDRGQYADEGGQRKPRARIVYADDHDERTGPEPDWGDIDRLGMHDLEDTTTAKRKTANAGKTTRGRLHSRAEERKKEVKWGEFK
jgi:hypothetical protein